MQYAPSKLKLGLAVLLAAALLACTGHRESGSAEPPESPQGAIALNWERPMSRTDGSSLGAAEIAGYRLYLGERPGEYTRVIDVEDPRQTSTILTELEPEKTYFIAISTVDRDGRESPKSRELRQVAKPLAETEAALREHLRTRRHG